ncbi:MAG: rhodanese-like domain-containing protein [Clostridia bacterium]|nr:rhodanese-like domain-containing protein [Clostridia bacterium]
MFVRLKKYMKRNANRLLSKEDITMEELKQKINNGCLVIDVRSPQEYNEWHIRGTVSIPEYEILKKINKYVKNKNEEIIVCCQSGYRSKKAQKELQKQGFVNVYNLYNGFENY